MFTTSLIFLSQVSIPLWLSSGIIKKSIKTILSGIKTDDYNQLYWLGQGMYALAMGLSALSKVNLSNIDVNRLNSITAVSRISPVKAKVPGMA